MCARGQTSGVAVDALQSRGSAAPDSSRRQLLLLPGMKSPPQRASFLAQSRRPRIGLATNALSSLGNFGLTLTIAHRSGLTGIGQYALAFSTYVLVTSMVQAGVTESVLTAKDGVRRRKDAEHEISLIGLILSAIVLAVGLGLGSAYLILTGLAIHGMLLYDYIKITNMAILDPRVALRQEVAWTLLTFAGVVAGLMRVIDGTVVYAIWALSGAAIGYLGAIGSRMSMMPRWPSNRTETRLTALYSFDQVIGPGTVQLTTFLLATLSGLAVVGALRAAGAFFSILTLVVSTGRTLAIPYLVPTLTREPRQELRAAVKITAVQVALLAPVAFAIALLPLSVCRLVVGASAVAAKPILVPLAIDAVLTVVATTAFSGHRAKRAGSRTVIVFLITCPLRLFLVLVAAHYWGAIGAAWGTATFTLLGTAIFWWSYRNLVMAAEAGRGRGSVGGSVVPEGTGERGA